MWLCVHAMLKACVGKKSYIEVKKKKEIKCVACNFQFKSSENIKTNLYKHTMKIGFIRSLAQNSDEAGLLSALCYVMSCGVCQK